MNKNFLHMGKLQDKTKGTNSGRELKFLDR